jgi:hypothetical protein
MSLSARGLAELRTAATLAHRLPLRVRVRHDHHIVLEVARPPFPEDSASRWLPPCAFRAAVGTAWRRHLQGEPQRFVTLPLDTDPAIDIGVPPGGCTRPGGLYELPWDGGSLHAFATTVDPGLCRRTAASVEVGYHTDPATDVSLFHILAADDEQAMAVDLMEGVLARLATEELLAGLPV